MHLGELNQQEDGIDLRFATLADKLRAVGWRNVLVGKTLGHRDARTLAHQSRLGRACGILGRW